jgi:hypothetical protein
MGVQIGVVFKSTVPIEKESDVAKERTSFGNVTK